MGADTQPVYCSLRSRIKCEVRDAGGNVIRVANVLNECIIDRGSSPVLSKLVCSVDKQVVTTVQADGIIVATPTGSTAYNASAGGCMVSPNVPALLITPVAPHSLSFRPIVVDEHGKQLGCSALLHF
jgi:NAD+ kinase